MLELLRDGTRFIEVDWERATAVVAQLAESGTIRPQQIGEQILSEHHVAARGRWRLLAERIRS